MVGLVEIIVENPGTQLAGLNEVFIFTIVWTNAYIFKYHAGIGTMRALDLINLILSIEIAQFCSWTTILSLKNTMAIFIVSPKFQISLTFSYDIRFQWFKRHWKDIDDIYTMRKL